MSRGEAFSAGVRAVAPLLIGVIPFGLIFGVTAAASGIGDLLGFATSIVIFAGAAQLAAVQLLEAGAALGVVIATVLVINARHMMYSAALADHFRAFPGRWRLGLPYLLTDQAFAVTIGPMESTGDPVEKRFRFLGAGLALWTTWQLTTGAGILLGAQVPEAWSLEFAIPLVFLALLAMSIKARADVVAALVGGAVAVLARGMPYQLAIIVAALAGVVAGIVAARGDE